MKKWYCFLVSVSLLLCVLSAQAAAEDSVNANSNSAAPQQLQVAVPFSNSNDLSNTTDELKRARAAIYPTNNTETTTVNSQLIEKPS